jgi:hypothetical protein
VVVAVTGTTKLLLASNRATPPVETSNQSAKEPDGTVALSVALPIPQDVPEIPTGKAGIELTVANTLSFVADLHPVVVFLACKKYFVVKPIDGVVYKFPVNKTLVVVEETDQSTTEPFSAVAESVKDPFPHLEDGVIDSITGNESTVAITGTGAETHPVKRTLA